MRVAVVGSRTFPQLDNVRWFVNELPDGIIVLSGGAHGVDTAASLAAKLRGKLTDEAPVEVGVYADLM